MAGLGGAIAMATVAMVGYKLTDQGAWVLLNGIGGLLRASGVYSPGFAGVTSVVGVVVHLLLGGLLGVLYASAQERLDSLSLLGVAIYYGLMLWFVSTFLVLSWLNPPFQQIMRTWPALAGHLAYGAVLGLYAISVSHNQAFGEPISPD